MDSVSDAFSYDQHQERSCPDGMYWCNEDQICKPDSQDMSVIVSTQEMMNESKILKEWGQLSRVLRRGLAHGGKEVEEKILNVGAKSAGKHINRYGVIDLENSLIAIMSRDTDDAFKFLSKFKPEQIKNIDHNVLKMQLNNHREGVVNVVV